MRKFVPSIALSGIATLIEDYGQDPLAIAKASALPEDALFSADKPISGIEFCDFVENAARACNQRFLGLELACLQGLQILGPIWLLMRSASTIGEALAILEKNLLLHTDVTAISLVNEFGGVSVCYEILDEKILHETQVIEHGLALCCLELKYLLGNKWVPEFTQFRYAHPYNSEPLERLFGKNLNFNQDRHAIHVSAQDMNQPFLSHHPEYRQILQRQLNSRHEMTDKQVVSKSEIVIRSHIATEACTLHKTASALGLSPRTLQNHLKRQGTGFQKLSDKVRLDMARKYLTQSNLTVAAVAERLHFSETAAFTRFLKRMTGLSPRQLLKQARPRDPA